MPSKRHTDRFNDIISDIDAIERCLSRISEAASKLGAHAEELAPDQPWPAIRGIGNRLRHEYDVVDKGELWRIFTSDLQSLRIACNAASRRQVAR